jgi:hypothetical protein
MGWIVALTLLVLLVATFRTLRRRQRLGAHYDHRVVRSASDASSDALGNGTYYSG